MKTLADFIKLESQGKQWETRRGVRSRPATFLMQSIENYIVWVEERQGGRVANEPDILTDIFIDDEPDNEPDDE